MVSYTGEEKKRYYRKIKEIWELNYIGEKLGPPDIWRTNFSERKIPGTRYMWSRCPPMWALWMGT
jgi:hypothetical protein